MKNVLALLLVVLSGYAGAAERRVNPTDLTEIRAVINRQIEAFQRDDARGAFELASPSVQQSFGTPERFLDVVRMAYRAVYRPSRVAFLDLVIIGGDVVQQLQLTDRAGGVWLAYYAMQRQEDGSWRACHLVQPNRVISASFAPASLAPR
jgi:hypothetical protein